MRKVLCSSSMLAFVFLASSCPKQEASDAPEPAAPSSSLAPVAAKAPEPAPPEPEAEPKAPPAPFDWARTTTDGEHLLAVAVAQRAKRFSPPGASGAATPEVLLQDDPPVKARAVYREDAEGCGGEGGGDCTGRWSLEVTVGKDRWQIVDFAIWTTDCAAIEDGFGRDGIRLEARDLVPGGAQELVIVGDESHASYLDDCDCTTRGGTSEHLWACGLVAEGKSWRPVCWAHVERSRSLGPTMDPQDCACAAAVSREAWTIEAEVVAPGRLRVTHDGRTDEHELATLPCGMASPPEEFACGAEQISISQAMRSPACHTA
jgi:hypothetical protein